MSSHEYTELHWVPLDDWPFDDTKEGVERAQTLAPPAAQWVRFYGDAPGFALLKEGAGDD
jgi:hypothetical protein